MTLTYKSLGKEIIMSDQELADLERRVAANPKDLSLRAKLYVTLVRMGRASEKALGLAAYHKDPAAMLVIGDKVPEKGVDIDQDLALFKDLPLQTLDFDGCYPQITDEGLEHLKDLPLQTLNLSACQKITDEGLKYLKDLPLRKLYLVWCQKITD